MPDFECPVARVIQGQPQSIPGIFRIQGRQLQWSPRDSSQGQSFKVALEAITGILSSVKLSSPVIVRDLENLFALPCDAAWHSTSINLS